MKKLRRVKCYLTRRANGLYLLTYYEPVIANVGNTDRKDAYIPPGDPIGFNNMCEWSVELLWGVKLDILETTRVVVAGGSINF